MRKYIHIYIPIVFACLLTITLAVTCKEGTANWDEDSSASAKSKTYASAEEAIKDMNSTDWQSSEIYNNVLNHDINTRKSLNETDRLSLQRNLNHTYAEQLVRTIGSILNSQCSDRHNTLNAAVAEYKKHERDFAGYVPPRKQEVMDAYAEHQEMLKFNISTSYNVPLSSCLDSYDSSYDSQKRSEAAAIRRKAPSCAAIKQKVAEQSVNNALDQRKQNYYAALAGKFCRNMHPSRAEYNRLLSILNAARNSASLISKVNAHWEKTGSDSYDF